MARAVFAPLCDVSGDVRVGFGCDGVPVRAALETPPSEDVLRHALAVVERERVTEALLPCRWDYFPYMLVIPGAGRAVDCVGSETYIPGAAVAVEADGAWRVVSPLSYREPPRGRVRIVWWKYSWDNMPLPYAYGLSGYLYWLMTGASSTALHGARGVLAVRGEEIPVGLPCTVNIDQTLEDEDTLSRAAYAAGMLDTYYPNLYYLASASALQVIKWARETGAKPVEPKGTITISSVDRRVCEYLLYTIESGRAYEANVIGGEGFIAYGAVVTYEPLGDLDGVPPHPAVIDLDGKKKRLTVYMVGHLCFGRQSQPPYPLPSPL